MNTIPLVDLATVHAPYRKALNEAAKRVMDRGWFILGPELESFEKAFAAYVGAKHCAGVGNGTDALMLALKALGVGPGDEVIVPAMSFIATALAVTLVGATPVYADVLEEDLLLDPASVKSLISSNTKAIIPVHLYGRMADMKALQTFGLPLVEDAAQAHGAERDGLKAGSAGTLACFSFYPTKNLGCLGDGGAVTTSDSDLHHKLTLLRNYGQARKYEHISEGVNSRLDELQAAFLSVRLDHLNQENASRLIQAKFYDQALAPLGFWLPKNPEGSHPVYHLYVLRAPNRDDLLEKLLEDCVTAAIHYPRAMYEHPSLQGKGLNEGKCPVAEKAAKELLSLPIYPGLRQENQERVVAALTSRPL